MSNQRQNAHIMRLNATGTAQGLALVLLEVPDFVLAQYRPLFDARCIKLEFVGGNRFIAARLAVLAAARDAQGQLPHDIAHEAEEWRIALAEFVVADHG